MSVYQPPEAIDWAEVIDESEAPPELEGSVREQGCQFHTWLESCFETAAVDFERELEWLNSDFEKVRGRYDCCDGHYVYEFKTVESLPANPREKDVQQISQYLDGLRLRHGAVVYIERESFDVCQFLLTVDS